MDYSLIFLGLASFFISILSVPLLIKFSSKYGLFDSICERKIHNSNISRLGGVGVFFGFFPVAVYIFFNSSNNNYFLLIGILLAFLSGFIDDLRRLRARYKLILQIVAAIFAVSSGLLIKELRVYTLINFEFGFFSYFITVFWIISFMNAVNLIDGMDGLSTGIILIANLFIIIISFLNNNSLVLSLSIALEFAILGFYIFNFPPAKIFLGDGGAYLIGYVYAVMPLMGIKKSAAITVFLIPMILMLIPISDIVSVMYKRLRTGQNIFNPDKNHLHHRMMNLGFSTRGILAVIYVLTTVLGCFSLLMTLSKPELTIFMLLFIVTFVGLLFFMLHRIEKNIEEIKSEGQSFTNSTGKNLIRGIMNKKIAS